MSDESTTDIGSVAFNSDGLPLVGLASEPARVGLVLPFDLGGIRSDSTITSIVASGNRLALNYSATIVVEGTVGSGTASDLYTYVPPDSVRLDRTADLGIQTPDGRFISVCGTATWVGRR